MKVTTLIQNLKLSHTILQCEHWNTRGWIQLVTPTRNSKHNDVTICSWNSYSTRVFLIFNARDVRG